MPIYGSVQFPGLNKVLDCSCSVGHGITPAVFILTISPQADFTADVGTLTLSDGTNSISFDDCRVDANSFKRNHSGLIWRWPSPITAGSGQTAAAAARFLRLVQPPQR